MARAWVAYERALRDDGALDFDDLVLRALRLLEADPAALARWRRRTATLLVDEAQDLDRTQLDLALLLAGEARNVTFVGDDDQTSSGSCSVWPARDRVGLVASTEPPRPRLWSASATRRVATGHVSRPAARPLAPLV